MGEFSSAVRKNPKPNHSTKQTQSTSSRKHTHVLVTMSYLPNKCTGITCLLLLLISIASIPEACSWVPPTTVIATAHCCHPRCCSTTTRLAATTVTLKIAVDATGGAADLAATASERFTCGASLDMVHRLRRDSDAVLIGKTTVVADNPSLTVRRVPPLKINDTEIQPLRVVLDSRLELLVSSEEQEQETVYQLFQDGYKTVVFYDAAAVSPPDGLPSFVTCCPVPTDTDGKLSVAAILETLEKQFQVHEVMVEGGPATAQAFLRASTVDRCILVRASTVRFVEPLASGITDSVLQQAGLQKLGTSVSGCVDQLEYWSRPDQTWPTPELADWP